MVRHFEREVPVDNNLFMGIDQSLSNTGLCLLKKTGESIEIIASESINTSISTNSIEERLKLIVDRIFDFMDTYKPGVVCIEGLAYKMNSNNGRLLAGLFFLILNGMYERGVCYRIVNIKTLKKFATGSGSADKNEMRNNVEESLISELSLKSGFRVLDKKFEDIVDSYFLALYGCNL